MKKRIFSMFLVIVMAMELLPGFTLTAGAEDYARWGGIIRLGYDAETDSWAWETYMDYDDPSLPRQYIGQLPTGVNYEEDTNTLTLAAASLDNVMVEAWAETPLNILVSGDVTVNDSHPYLASLNIDSSSAVTIRGKSGDRSDTLSLYSEMTNALRFDCTVPFHNGLFDLDGCLTVENLTLTATSDYHGDSFQTGDPAVILNGSTRFDNVALTADSYFGIDASGDIVYDGCTVIAPTVRFGFLDMQGELYGGESCIKDSIFTITAIEEEIIADVTLMRIDRNVLTVDGSSVITIDAGKAPPSFHSLVVWRESEGPAAGFYMKNGTLDIKLQNGEDLEGIVESFAPISIHNGGNWTQTGGSVTVTFNSGECYGDMETFAVNVYEESTFYMQGGSFTVDNINDEGVDVYGSKVMALCGFDDSSLNFTGGTFTATGTADKPYDVAVWVFGEMIVTGDAVLDLKGTLQTETMTSHIEIFDGTLNIHSVSECVNIGSAMSVYGGVMNLTTSADMEGIFAYRGNVRFLGGEVNITAGSALTWQTHADQMTFGEGIKAAFSDGTEAVVQELYLGDTFLGWATNADYIYAGGETQTVTIKRQGVKADAAESSVTLEITNTTALVAGVPLNFRLIPTLTSTSGTLTLTLPDTLIFGGVTVNSQKVVPVVTADGLSLTVNHGDIVRFTATPNAVGRMSVSASVNGVTAVVDLEVENYTLSVPSVIREPDFTVFGSSVPGSTVTFYEKNGSISTIIGSITANAAGTWQTELHMNGVAGTHTVYAVVVLDGETIATSRDYTVTYDDTRAVVETLTITNTIHGATAADPDQEVTVTLNYTDGTRTQNYYIYWPELPEFRFDVKFVGEKSTPAYISDVAVIATDRLGETARVPLTYDALRGMWTGTHEFCNYGNIVPEKFRVVWREVGFTGEEEETTDPVEMPSMRDEPEEYRNDFTTDAFVYVEPGTFALPLAAGTTEIQGVSTITGEPVDYSLSNDTCFFSVTAGEMYVVDADGCLVGEYEESTRLLVIGAGGAGSSATLRDGVIEVSAGSIVFDDTTGTFASALKFAVGDVIYTDDGRGVVVTGAENDTYTCRDAYLGEIYQTLDVGIMNTDALAWDIDEEAVAAQFMETPLFASYTAAIEATFSTEYELDDHKVSAAVTARADSDGVLSIEPVVTVTTSSKTRLPNEAEQETTITATFSGSIKQDYDFRVRYDGDTENFALYFTTTNTITDGFDIQVSLSIGEGEDEEVDLSDYLDEIEEEILANLLAELNNESEKTASITLTRLSIPTPVPGVMVYAEPSFTLNWGFFGEMGLGATIAASGQSGFAVTRIDGEWVTATFGEYNSPELSANVRLHVTSFIEAMLRIDAGVSLLRVFDAGIYAMVGPRLEMAGHGVVAYPIDDCEAELTVRFGLRAEAGVHIGIGISDNVSLFDKDISVFEQYIPLGSAGWGEMPTRFDVIEGPDPVLKPKEYYLVEHIPLAMQVQIFEGGEERTKVYSENNYERYTFEVLEGPVHIEGSGASAKVVVDDPTRSCTYSIRITFVSNNYTLYKVVPLCYEPGYIEVHVSAEEVPPIAEIEICDLENPEKIYRGSSDNSGYLIVAVPEGNYSVAQISPPAGNVLVSASPVEPVVVRAGNSGSAAFENGIPSENETYDFPLPDIGDPSGYVYEGIESNRLEGVKTTVYYKPTENSDDIIVWDASAYDQQNPLYTDVLGQYLWMVPSGWWQVKYELDGYTSVLSEWMEVPPIRTGVNINLTSMQPAEMKVEYSEQNGCLLLRFNRPVKLHTISQVSIEIDGVPYEGSVEITAADAAWSVTTDPQMSTVCATVFCVWIEDSVVGRRVTVSLDDVETYNGVVGTVTDSREIPRQAVSYTVTFDANGGSVVPASGKTRTDGKLTSLPVPTRSGYIFRGWYTASVGGVKVTGSYIFTSNTTVFAQWTEILPTVYTVTLVSNGGTIHSGNVTEYTYGVGAILPVHVTRNGYRFGGWYDNEACRGMPVTEIRVTDIGDKTFYAKWEMDITSVFPLLIQYEIEISDGIFGGSVTTDKSAASVNEKVTITVVPFAGYELDTVTVLDRNGNAIDITSHGDGTYSFQMPMKDVLVNAVFCAKEETTDVTDVCPRDATCPMFGYTDLDRTAWYHDGVHFCMENGLMNGVGDNRFDPDQAITRAMIVTILWRLEGCPAMRDAQWFEDVPTGQWYSDAIAWAAYNGIVDGYGNGMFGTNDVVTREQMVTILFRYAGYRGYDVSASENTGILSCDDAAEVSAWAISAMQWACGENIIQGVADGLRMNLVPRGITTRAQAATILQRFLEHGVKNA